MAPKKVHIKSFQIKRIAIIDILAAVLFNWIYDILDGGVRDFPLGHLVRVYEQALSPWRSALRNLNKSDNRNEAK